ncbi:MAG: response regulator [Reyranella sp.]|uniref:response regulator n=1 Tax=Reyranella sp. TaxID=1929291 RepID=UPI001AD202E9|nr:response regulator [Reyranella sp.]MBN9085609.1 response regulator [Reyranella sp.]
MKLAIVEDEVILAMALTLMLEDWGHRVVGTADSEASALALFKATQPDAVVMDVRLGRRDSGLRAAGLIRSLRDVPIVFCTAYADTPSIQAEVRGIGNAYLVGKPVDEDQFEYLLRSIELRQRKMATDSSVVSRFTRVLQPASNDL